MTAETRPAQQVAIDTLAAQAQTADEHAQVEAMQAEFTQLREEATRQMGEKTVKLIDVGGGTIATEKEVKDAKAQGQKITTTSGTPR